MYLDDNNVLHMIMVEGVRLDFEDAIDNALVIKNLTGGKHVLKLIDASVNFRIEKKAREFINNVDAKQTIARAVVKSSILNSLVIGFFTTLSKPKVRTKIFSNYNEAYKWLMDFKKSN